MVTERMQLHRVRGFVVSFLGVPDCVALSASGSDSRCRTSIG